MPRSPDLIRGSLDLMILTVISRHGPDHGYGIMRRIHQASDEVLTVEEGSLYPALHRLERRGALTHEWRQSESNRRARYYDLTDEGRAQLRDNVREWTTVTGAIGRVLGATRAAVPIQPEPAS